MLADNLLIFDNLRQTIKVMSLVHLDPELSHQAQYERAVADIEALIQRLDQPVPAQPGHASLRKTAADFEPDAGTLRGHGGAGQGVHCRR